jgi:hypothetical protein
MIERMTNIFEIIAFIIAGIFLGWIYTWTYFTKFKKVKSKSNEVNKK